jgi:hypothetical protein
MATYSTVTIRQHEGKSYRMFADWLVETPIWDFLQLYKILHYKILQKFTDRINVIMLGKVMSSFIYIYGKDSFNSIDSTGFKITYAS